jgi:acid stress-induced BolA-like protein IbaG/YrbA
VHYYHEAEPGSDVVVRGKGSPFKANIVSVNFEDEGIMYTVCHVTDNFTHVVHISDFVAMGDGSYPRMKRIAKADALTHKTWVRVMEDF